MLAQFRSRYPTGSLISELLAIDHGKYVVRVLVQVDSAILATALAAADTVEAAEDQARQRALQVLGIESGTALPNLTSRSSLPESPIPSQLEPSPVSGDRKLIASQSSERSTSRVSEESLTTSETEAKTDFPTPATSSEDWLSATYLNPSSPSQKSAVELPPELAQTTSKGRGASLPPLPEIPSEDYSEESTDTPDPTAMPQSSNTKIKRTLELTDLSSEIARTDIELKRLGWSAEQGVEYLQATYGKRSRRQLSEDELLDFLHYLECLPTPSPNEDFTE